MNTAANNTGKMYSNEIVATSMFVLHHTLCSTSALAKMLLRTVTMMYIGKGKSCVEQDLTTNLLHAVFPIYL